MSAIFILHSVLTFTSLFSVSNEALAEQRQTSSAARYRQISSVILIFTESKIKLRLSAWVDCSVSRLVNDWRQIEYAWSLVNVTATQCETCSFQQLTGPPGVRWMYFGGHLIAFCVFAFPTLPSDQPHPPWESICHMTWVNTQNAVNLKQQLARSIGSISLSVAAVPARGSREPWEIRVYF